MIGALCGIYCIRNKVNGKFYIGSSVNCYHRVRSQHYARLRRGEHTNPHLQASWTQYGEVSFECFLIEECQESVLLEVEQEYLDNSGCLNPSTGYNINQFADRVVLTPEQCRKISIAKMGHAVSEETRKKIGEISKKQKWTEERRQKFIAKQTGSKRSEESRKRMSEAQQKYRKSLRDKNL